MEDETYMTVADMCRELRVPRSTMYRWLSTGKGPNVLRMPNKKYRIKRSDFLEWVSRHEIRTEGGVW